MEDRKRAVAEEKDLRKKTPKPYSAPELRVHGSVERITEGGGGGFTDTGTWGSR